MRPAPSTPAADMLPRTTRAAVALLLGFAVLAGRIKVCRGVHEQPPPCDVLESVNLSPNPSEDSVFRRWRSLPLHLPARCVRATGAWYPSRALTMPPDWQNEHAWALLNQKL